MGTSWNYFKEYVIKPEEDGFYDVIHYLDGDSLGIGFATSAHLSSVLEHFGVVLPVYNQYEPPANKKIEDLVEPQIVFELAVKGIELLNKHVNPLVNLTGELEPLFDYDDLRDKTAEQLNENIRNQLAKISRLSKDGYFFVRDRD